MKTFEKGKSLFKYIKELNSLKSNVIYDISKSGFWKLELNKVQTNEYVEIRFIHNQEESENDEEISFLTVKKPKMEDAPKVTKRISEWVSDDWYDYKKEVYLKDTIIKNNISNNIKDFPKIKKEFDKLIVERNLWVKSQREKDKVLKLFDQLHKVYVEMEKLEETQEIMIGQGIFCFNYEDKSIYHPILLKKVNLTFDPKENKFCVLDSDNSSEFYNKVFDGLLNINNKSIKEAKEALEENDYHPFNLDETKDFLVEFARSIRHDSEFVSLDDKQREICIYDSPTIFIRKKNDGVERALELIIEDIDEHQELSKPLIDIIGDGSLVDNIQIEDSKSNLFSLSGEDKEILLTKTANHEQLEIAKRINNYNAVLVQGPPGTGKTHTISNLIGHFLSQGNSILVTSHTRKALSVVKSKIVPELQDLCISVIEDNNKDMGKTIDGIIEYTSRHNELELQEKIDKLENRRETIISNLEKIRHELYSVKNKEYESIIYNGKGYSVAEAATFVNENREKLSYIPGKVESIRPFPLSNDELDFLYSTNKSTNKYEELELEFNLVDPNKIINPKEFSRLVTNREDVINKIRLKVKYVSEKVKFNEKDFTMATVNNKKISIEDTSKLKEILEEIKSTEIDNITEWQKDVILAGKQKIGHTGVWKNFTDKITSYNEYSILNQTKTIGNEITFIDSSAEEYSIDVANQIFNYLSKGKKVNFTTFIFNSKWKKYFENIKVNGNNPSAKSDFEIIIIELNKKTMINEIERFWKQLITLRGGLEFSEIGELFEIESSKYVNNILEYLSWYESKYRESILSFYNLGFPKDILPKEIGTLNEYQQLDFDLDILYNFIVDLLELYLLIEELNEINDKLKYNVKIISSTNSKLNNNIRNYALEFNVEKYKLVYAEMKDVYSKSSLILKRKELINNIEEVAPDWALSLRNRIDLHGNSTVPIDIKEAWKWKQFATLVENITSLPFEELQFKSLDLSKQLRYNTAKLAEYKAWKHIIQIMNQDITKKQSLEGWKQTTRKIGKGTGKKAAKYKREARILMAHCQTAVPAWIMPINKALETLNPRENKFDVVIIDEASQSDISALAIFYFAKKVIVVGDDEQVSPSGIGLTDVQVQNLMNTYIKGEIPNSHLYDLKTSLYDISKTTFQPLMLKEHFRCVPEIIGYSNQLSYNHKIKPLRDDSNVKVKPSTISYKVDGVRTHKKTNDVEAKSIVALMLACMNQAEYEGLTFGVITLVGSEQAKLVDKYARKYINTSDYFDREILCGTASDFQGDERDVMFLTLVDNNNTDGPLKKTGEGANNSTKQRYNVAMSRAKDQVWVVHSLDKQVDLKPDDMRKQLLDYVENPKDFEILDKKIQEKSDSPFEKEVARFLVKKGYNIVQQYKVGAYRLDIVVNYANKKIVVECDGELYHSGTEKVREDLERQIILERLGWKFIRIRGSEYYLNKENRLNKLIEELESNDILPEENIEIERNELTDLQERVYRDADKILKTMK